MISLSGVTKRYGAATAVQDLSFTVNSGETLGMLGQNGAGKTTTLNIITGYLAPTSGDVRVGDYDLLTQPRQAKRLIGYLPEQPPLYDEMTVESYLRFVCRLRLVVEADIARHVRDIAAQTNLSDVLGRRVGNLSKGYRQRVGIAQALLGNPQYIILDEPTVGLDPLQIIEIRDLIRELGQKHTVILSSHILSEVQAICESVLIIAHGKLVAFDTPQNLEKTLANSNKLSLCAPCTQEKMAEILASVPVVAQTKFSKGENDTCRAELTVNGELNHAAAEIFFAFAKAEIPLLQMTPQKADLENIFIELTESEPTLPEKEDVEHESGI